VTAPAKSCKTPDFIAVHGLHGPQYRRSHSSPHRTIARYVRIKGGGYSTGDDPLTSREREVLAAATGGATVADIAARLSISEGTVRNRLSIAIQEVGGRNRFEAARLAEQKGWV
jgi:DNA-binding NarL/FixJ family response regulator